MSTVASSSVVVSTICLLFTALAFTSHSQQRLQQSQTTAAPPGEELVISAAAYAHQIRTDDPKKFLDGRNTFRFDTFGDEDFWGGMLKLHEAIEGAKLGGVG